MLLFASLLTRVPFRTPARLVASATATSGTQAQRGTLYVVATPIGNLGDVTTRASAVLRSVDVIAAEDTRVTATLLHSLWGRDAKLPRMLSCHEHNAYARVPQVLTALQGGSVALVTDAGTPAVSDPGSVVVAAVAAAGHSVSAVPGACAVAAALSVSGLGAGAGHLFLGFLPRSGTARKRAFAAAVESQLPVVLYEAPHRLRATLSDLANAAPDRPLCVARELTKRYETVYHFESAEEASRHFAEDEEPRGEFVLVIGPAPRPSKTDVDVTDAALQLGNVARGLIDAGVPVKTAAAVLAESAKVSRKEVYQYLLQCKAEMAADAMV